MNKIERLKKWTSDHRYEIVIAIGLVPVAICAVLQYSNRQKGIAGWKDMDSAEYDQWVDFLNSDAISSAPY